MCQPAVHPFNLAAVELYNVIGDQVIVGFGGAIGLNDIAVAYAMDNYFEVKKRDKLPLSLAVRRLCNKILVIKSEKASEKKK